MSPPMLKVQMEGYGIYSPSRNQWSMGKGTRWGKKGKVWSQIGHVKNHIGCNVWRHFHKVNNDYVSEYIFRPDYDDALVYDIVTGSPVDTCENMMKAWMKRQHELGRFHGENVSLNIFGRVITYQEFITEETTNVCASANVHVSGDSDSNVPVS